MSDAQATVLAVTAHGAGDLRIDAHPIPSTPDASIRVRPRYGGICGSDLHYFRHGRVGSFELREPLVLGHEVVGELVDPVSLADGQEAAIGTLVAIHPASYTEEGGAQPRPNITPAVRYLGSAAAQPHEQGAFAECIRVRPDQIRVIPEGLSLRRAVLAEPLAVALHAIKRSGTITGRRVLVTGAGPIGLLLAGAAHRLGASEVVVTDIHEFPLGVAAMLGPIRGVRVGREDLPAAAFDTVFEASGAPSAVAAALRSVASGGVIVQVGILPGDAVPYRLSELVSREIDYRGSFRFIDELGSALELLARAPEFDAVITREFSVGAAQAAFDFAADPASSAKVVLEFDDWSQG